MTRPSVLVTFDYRDVDAVPPLHEAIGEGAVAVAGFESASRWDGLLRNGDPAVREAIDTALDGTTVTLVAIGPHAAASRWITYALRQSTRRGNGLLGVLLPGTPHTAVPRMLEDAGGDVYDWNAPRVPAWVDAAAARATV